MIPKVSHYLLLLPWSIKAIDSFITSTQFWEWQRKERIGLVEFYGHTHVLQKYLMKGEFKIYMNFQHMVESMFDGNQSWRVGNLLSLKVGIEIGNVKMIALLWNVGKSINE